MPPSEMTKSLQWWIGSHEYQQASGALTPSTSARFTYLGIDDSEAPVGPIWLDYKF